MSANELMRRAETAWLENDLTASTAALRALNGATEEGVYEAPFDPAALPSGVTAEPLTFRGRPLQSHLVTFASAAALFDVGVPLLPDGTFYSQAFAHLKYPERYTHLFGNDAAKALHAMTSAPAAVTDAYITVIRPPYYHWLLDTLPHLIGAARLANRAKVHLIAPTDSPLKPWQQGLLAQAAALFGIENLAWLPVSGTAVGVAPGHSQTRLPLAERLAVISALAGGTGRETADRLVYARRSAGERRQLVNEDDVIAGLGPHVDVIEPGAMSFDDQVAAFARARCVIGVHGSNLTNIAFCRPGTAVVEIAAGLPQPHFERLCQTAGFKFHRVTAAPEPSPDTARVSAPKHTHPTWAEAHGDLRADPARVKSAVDEALG